VNHKNSKSMKSEARNPNSEFGRILIVDDEEIVHLTLKRLLEPEGYSIDSAYGGEEALSKLAHCGLRNAECRINDLKPEIRNLQSGYDLLILDIRMPDVDGIQVLREIRKRELDIEVLILTGYATMESATQALNYGARGYLMKPIENGPEFRNRVHEAVHIARLARENKQFYDAIVSGQVDSVTIDGKVYQVPALREENKEVFQRLMEVIRDAVVFLDFDGNITFSNVNFAKMLGESYQNLLGARFESYIVEEERDRVIEAFTRLSTGQVAVSIPAQLKTSFGSLLSIIISASPIYYKAVSYTHLRAHETRHDLVCRLLLKSEDSVQQFSHWRGEIIAISKDRNKFPVEITGSRPGSRPGGRTDNRANIICFARDLSERKRAEEALRALTAQTERMNAIATLAAGIAHELNNPMMGMLNFAQYCLKHTPVDDRRYPVLQDMKRETQRCVNIVKNLLTFSRTGKEGEEEYQKESLATIIDRVVRLLSYRIEKEHVAVTQHIAEGTPEIWMKVNGIQQVFLNLMSNALDALTEGEKKEIHVEAEPEGEFLQMTVSDSGHGIPPESLERIFEPFFSTKPVGQGTGLGLSVSRNIIRKYGGSITCESKPGDWTKFKVLLPVDGRTKEATR